MRESAEILKAIVPAGHPSIITSLGDLAKVLQELGESAEARATWNEVVVLARQASPMAQSTSPECCGVPAAPGWKPRMRPRPSLSSKKRSRWPSVSWLRTTCN